MWYIVGILLLIWLVAIILGLWFIRITMVSNIKTEQIRKELYEGKVQVLQSRHR